MANTYDAEAATAAPEGDPSTNAQDTPEAKVSQEQANYRMGAPVRSCGLCANFGGSFGENAFTCRVVDGEISPFGFSDSYARQDNPFIAGTQASFDEGSETPEQDAAQQEPESPSLKIGNRSY